MRGLIVVVFAVAMAWVESAVVFYLRTMIDRIEPFQPNPLPEIGALEYAELVREPATLLMLLTVGWLAGRTWRSRLAYTTLAFGVWDIFYYVFLKVLTGWPHSLFDWDILFLLPLPWWGPVLAPMLIAGLMIVWGTLVIQLEEPERPLAASWKVWSVNLLGAALALYVFMADALRVAGGGSEALRNLLPTAFNWPLFCTALLLMAAPVMQQSRRLNKSSTRLGICSIDNHE
ncbi:MAG TPA: hypothetical protein VGK40_00960 [Verrucomicrobiae bacterium]